MRVPDADGTVTLTHHGRLCLAAWLVIERLRDAGDTWATWDEVPRLTEDEHHMLLAQIEVIASFARLDVEATCGAGIAKAVS